MKFKVMILEFERGWGQRVDGVKYFDSADYEGDADRALAAAREFVKDFNKENVGPVPDWYMKALAPQMVEADNGQS